MLKTPLKTLLDILINRFTKERLVTLILQNDEKLLIFMLEHENANDYKNAFFKMIANTLVFNEKALLECLEKYLETKELDRSFTRFKNKIGLYSQGRPIKSSELVVLNFPFKDNVLLGNAKDNSTKSNELFYHEILHKNEIDTLLHKKALCRFEMHGQGDLENALKDKNTNYLIKGNNLIALHSLKKKFAKQVKCIYIDPPYNTGNDSFNYNDNFNHSSWLVFMKNRLEAAREFLSDDGVIFVQCDDNEQAYLKVLMDEIFGRENFEVNYFIQVRYGDKTLAEKNNYQKLIEQILCYKKNTNFIPNKDKENYSIENFVWKIDTKTPIKTIELKGRIVEIFTEQNYQITKELPNENLLKETWASGTVLTGNASGKFFDEYLSSRVEEDGLKVLYKVHGIGEDGLGYRFFTGPKKIGAKQGKFYSGIPLVRLKEMKEGKSIKYKPIENFIDLSGSFGNCRLEGDASFRAGKKPEALISRILEISTQENDLVLDFFAGSGTTCAVAHKMKRRYIGIEQMDYIETITKERLKKVIEGEQGGISKKCGFKGGGSFVYAELKEVNLEIKKQILNAKSADECLKIFNDLNERILKRADCKMDEIDSEEFHNLDLNEQKRICCASLDSNEDYLNLGDIDEDAWGIDESTKKYNEIFYS
ncbi:adenine-specific DNA-methyltransferase [Helicobacter pylori NQ4228]|uniref:site-specific DNA-methyltransferase n=1 Tax=Helicobacter pylori TaxID=210 RepID=UPI00026AA923|nr:site-specific DNA-methyltransferase [Helicobacter pylori]EJB27680.1 adenine-specific DNA-methyltransferase [Helicobacter pylori NQ4228]